MQKNNRQHRYKPPSNQAQTAGLMSKQQAAQNTKKASDELLKTDSERASDAYNRQVADIQNNPSLTDAQKNKYIAKLTDNKVKYDWGAWDFTVGAALPSPCLLLNLKIGMEMVL